MAVLSCNPLVTIASQALFTNHCLVEFNLGNIRTKKMYLHFLSFPNIEKAQVVAIHIIKGDFGIFAICCVVILIFTEWIEH